MTRAARVTKVYRFHTSLRKTDKFAARPLIILINKRRMTRQGVLGEPGAENNVRLERYEELKILLVKALKPKFISS